MYPYTQTHTQRTHTHTHTLVKDIVAAWSMFGTSSFKQGNEQYGSWASALIYIWNNLNILYGKISLSLCHVRHIFSAGDRDVFLLFLNKISHSLARTHARTHTQARAHTHMHTGKNLQLFLSEWWVHEAAKQYAIFFSPYFQIIVRSATSENM